MHDPSHFTSQIFDLQTSMSRLAQAMGLRSAVGILPEVQTTPRHELAEQIARTLHYVSTEPGLSESLRQSLGLMCRRWRQASGCSWDEIYAAWPEESPRTGLLH